MTTIPMPPGARGSAGAERACSSRRLRLWFCALSVTLVAAGCARNRATSVPVPATPAPEASAPAASAAPTAPATPSVPFPGPSLTAPFEPGAYSEEGRASWYGDPFNGRRTSDGEVYDMNQLVAAHRTLPFGSMVRVTNLMNGLSTLVRIVDRGPFVEGRIIDLSLAAARSIDMVGPGTATVRVDLVSSPSPLTGYFTVQVGAFSQRENAERLRSQFQGQYQVTLQEYDSPGGHFYRVRIGRETNQVAAAQIADTLIKQGLPAFVVRIDGLH